MNTNYKISGTPNSPVLVLSNSLGATYHMWDEVVNELLPYFRVLQYDTRGHGQSEKPSGAYTIEEMGRDVIDLLDHLSVDKAYFCGVSMGGLIGQWLCINARERFHKVVMSNTAAQIGKRSEWQERINVVNEAGMSAIAEATMQKWFSPGFENKQRLLEMFLDADVQGYASCCRAIAEADFKNALWTIDIPTLIITGDEDLVTDVNDAKYLYENISGSELKILAGRHLVNVEAPHEYAQTIIDFFIGHTTYDRGMHVRGTVLGHEHLSRIKGKTNDFTEAFQDLIAHVPWGKVWTRPGLKKKERSFVTLSAMIAMGKEEEFKMHVRAAFNNGVTVDELKELILQTAIYCGFPAAYGAYRAAEEIMKEMNMIK